MLHLYAYVGVTVVQNLTAACPPVSCFWLLEIAYAELRFPGDALSRLKSGILNFTAAGQIAPAECILLYLVAAADPDDAVAHRGEELLKKR